jgi:hypothetical protein
MEQRTGVRTQPKINQRGKGRERLEPNIENTTEKLEML